MIGKNFGKDAQMAMDLTMRAHERMQSGKMVLPSTNIEQRKMLMEKASLLYDFGNYVEDDTMVTVKEPTDDDLLADILLLTYEIKKGCGA